MKWIVFLIISVLCLAGATILAVIRSKVKIFFIGVVLSATVLFIPIYGNIFATTECGVFETVLLAIHNVIRLFIVDGEFQVVTSNLVDVSPLVYKAYTVLFSILFVLAPILTFGFVLSFFKNISAYKSYITHYNSDAFIFSELNEKSLELARSLYSNNPKKRFFVFNDVFEKEEEASYELIQKAKEIGAICFKKDILVVNYSIHSKKSGLYFFTIGQDQSENINQTLKLIDKYQYREKTHLYVFTVQSESEVILSNALNRLEQDKGDVKIKVRRVNEVVSLITRNLYENGYEKIFSSAYLEDGVKKINAVVIGMGQIGIEMMKALPWFCQMDGYRVEIHSFDRDEKAMDKFSALCPELMDSKHNGNFDVVGDAKYKITIHSGTDVETKTFDDIISALPRSTYVFVALGDDERNISTAMRLRTVFARKGYCPEIQAIVCDTNKREALAYISNFKGQKYNIDFIGDVKSSYSAEVILKSDIEEEALKRHLKWGEEAQFWQYDYNYKSSVAFVIHRKMKLLCGIPGIEKDPEDRSEEELWSIRILEHSRWSAYTRSEGYVYGGTVEKSGRNDLAKMHNCLVPFSELPSKEQEKDDV